MSIPNLEPCLRYWVRVSAVLCDVNVNSDPKRIDLREEEDFSFLIRLGGGDECRDWILQERVLLDVQGEVSSQLAECGLSQVLCTADDDLSCSTNHSNAMYRYQSYNQ